MAVWVDITGTSNYRGNRRNWGDWGDTPDPYEHGPYVHLDQFMEEVERRAGGCAEERLSFDPEFVDAARELAKEIKEQHGN